MAQVISEQEPLPEWLQYRQGMLRQTRMQTTGPIEGLRLISGRGVKRVRDRPLGCGCFVNADGDRHFDDGVLLNPDTTTIDGRNIALLYDNLMYVGTMTAAYLTDTTTPRVQVGQAESMWWVVSTLTPGWYDNQGNRVEYTFNPRWLDVGTQVMPTRVANGTRMLGQMVEWQGGSRGRLAGNRRVATDRSGEDLNTWALDTYINPRPEHRPAMPPPVPVQWVDPTADFTVGQKTARLNERFAALTEATISKARDEDWCDDYNMASQMMGLAEEDYLREQETTPTSFEVSITLRYDLSASVLDTIISNQFGGSHDIQDSVDVESPVRVTVTQDNDDWDEDSHDLDEVLESAGYSDYDEYTVTSWRTL